MDGVDALRTVWERSLRGRRVTGFAVTKLGGLSRVIEPQRVERWLAAS
jgi:hypothetical protein